MSERAVSIIGATLTGNHGAEAMLSAVAADVRQRTPAAPVHVFSYYPKEDCQVKTTAPVHIHSARPLDLVLKVLPQAVLWRISRRVWTALPGGPTSLAIAALASSRALVCVAGVSFIDGRRRFLLYNVATLLPALVMGTPVIKLSQAMGRFDDPINRVVARRVLRRLAVIVSRGEESHAAVRSLLPDRDVLLAPDVAFSLGGSEPLVSSSPVLSSTLRNWHARSGEPVLGVCPSALLAGEGAPGLYPAAVGLVIRSALTSGYRVIVFPTATRPGSAETHNNDLPLLKALRETYFGASSDRILWADDVTSYADVSLIAGVCDALVTSRFHAMIAGLSAGVPSLVIGWSHKYREVLAMFGLERLSFSLYDLDDERLEATLAQFLAGRADVARRIADRLPEVREAAAAQLEVLEISP